MAQVLHLRPTFRSRPVMRMLGIHGTGGIKIDIGFLCSGYNYQYAVNVPFQLFIRVSLKQIAGTFNRLVHIGIIKGKPFYLIVITGMGRFYEILIATGFFAFAECQRNSYFTACMETLSPKSICHLHCGERYGINRISRMYSLLFLCRHTARKGSDKRQGY